MKLSSQEAPLWYCYMALGSRRKMWMLYWPINLFGRQHSGLRLGSTCPRTG